MAASHWLAHFFWFCAGSSPKAIPIDEWKERRRQVATPVVLSISRPWHAESPSLGTFITKPDLQVDIHVYIQSGESYKFIWNFRTQYQILKDEWILRGGVVRL